MFKKLAVTGAKMYGSYLAINFLWGVGYGIKYQIKNGVGTKPTTQEIANAYFGIKV